ncbi:Abhydrolase domain containing 18 [Trinorchestia longiramus]|nr:Abhydrolase domain containing 18 [Trinorchestia longiramus]
MASLACCSWPRPVPLVPCLSWTTASGVFTQGVLSGAINWELLTDQYFSNQAFRDELFNLIHSPEGHFSIYHKVGQKFARTYPEESGNASDRSTTSTAAVDCPESTSSGEMRSHGDTVNSNNTESMCNNDGVHKSVESPNGKAASDCGNFERRSEPGPLCDPETESVRRARNPENESIFLASGNINSSSNGKTGERFYTSSNDASNINIDECSENSGFSHLDAQSNDLNAFNCVSTKKKQLDNIISGSFETRSNSSSERSFDYIGGSSFSVSRTFISGDTAVGSTGSVSANTSTGTRNVMSSTSTNSNKSGLFTQTKPSTEKLSRGILTTFNPLKIIGLSSTGANSVSRDSKSEDTSSKTPVSGTKKLLQQDEKRLPKQRLDLLFGRYLKESTQKIISSSTSLFNWESGKSAFKDDPHMGFTPIGIRPVSSQHQNMVSFKPYFTVKDPLTWEAVQFMRGIMDECTHVANFGRPTDPELIIIIQATKDAYEPSDTMTPLDQVWPGAELRTVDAGHIEAFVLHHQLFREAVRDAFLKTYERYRLTEDWTQGGKPCIAPDQL